ncbi:MAG: hypothetical protein WC196_04095 [Bacilli bacterium]|nr:hypothetical protein [Bacilli bacterium]
MQRQLKYLVFILACLVLAYEGLTSFIMGLDLSYANSIQNLAVVLSRHSWLPLTHIYNSMLQVQYLNYANFQSVLAVIVYFFEGFGLIEWLGLCLVVIVAIIYSRDEETLSYSNLVMQLVGYLLFFIEILITIYYAFRVFYAANLNTYAVLGGVSIVYMVIGLLVMLISLLGFIYIIYKWKSTK